ncbi:MAG: hypothetical protein J7M26_08545, partial [Armatimonadetes bacterium]|nr:hypothetical protein [Armatimonadota bacterium]
MMTLVLVATLLAAPSAPVQLDWGTATLRLDDHGCVAALVDKASGRELAVPGHPFCELHTEGGWLKPISVAAAHGQVSFSFPDGATVTYHVRTAQGFSLWELTSFGGVDPAKLSQVKLAALNLNGLKTLASPMNAYYDDTSAVALMATSLNVRGQPFSAKSQGATKGLVLRLDAFARHGLLPAGFGIIACPRSQFEKTIEAFEKAAGLPSPHPGGKWGKLSPWTKRSYLFITSFGEADTDEVIKWAKRGGFGMILIGGSSWSTSSGHYRVNRKRFPDGLPSLVRTVDRLRKAGFPVGLHFLGAAVYVNDPYVWPRPDPRLVKDAWAELAADVDKKADFLPTVAEPKGFPAEDGGYRGRGTYLQIGDELIHYSKLKTDAPFGFASRARGALRTTAAPHRKGAKIAHLRRSYGYFLYDLDSSLADE